MATPPAATSGLARTHRRHVEEDVRRLVARELHDRVAQTLTAMLVDLENFKSQQVAWEDVLQQLETVQSSTRQVLANLRELLHDLRGDDLIGDDFVAALAGLVSRFEQRTQISANLDVMPGWPNAQWPSASLNLYRIVEEALTNVRLHSGAHSVRIVLDAQSPGELGLIVSDDGDGFDAQPGRPMGLGTIGMKERALFLGGRLWIEGDVGHGTRVRVVFPKNHLARASDSSQSTPLRAPAMPA